MSWYQNDYRKTWNMVDSGSIIRIGTSGTDTDEATARGKATLFAIKDKLTEAGTGAWTVLASSDGTTASTADNWASPDDLVWAANDTTARSWVLLQSPTGRAGTFYLLIDYYGTNTRYAHLTFTKSQPNISSPQINARPPATGDEWQHTNAVICVGSASDQWVTSFALVRATDGSFFAFSATPRGLASPTEDNDQFFRTYYIFNVLQNAPPWDTVGAASLIVANQSTETWYATSMPFQSLHSDGTQVNLSPVWLNTYVDPMPNEMHTNPWTGNYVSLPVWLVCADGGKVCWRGQLEDIFWLPSSMADGFLLFKNELVKAIKVGPFSCPMFERSGLI